MLRRGIQSTFSCGRVSLITRHNRCISTTTRPAEAVIEEEGASTHPLYYHLIPGPNAVLLHDSFAMSFLKTPPITPKSRTILGFLPSQGEEPGLADFKQNSKFVELMHTAIKSALRDNVDEVIAAEAQQRGNGWLNINDTRNVPALGRIGDPDDIVGAVLVQDGQILADTYQPMPSYRTCTADGPVKLTEGLSARLVEVLKEESAREEALVTSTIKEP